MGRGTVQATLITILFTTIRGTKGDEKYSTQAAAAQMYGTDWEKNQRHGQGVLAIDSLEVFPPR